jgi:hypothetical protein
MRRYALFALLATAPLHAAVASFRVEGTDAAPWRKIFQSVNINEDATASIVVLGQASKTDPVALAQNHFVILEGIGLPFQADKVSVRQIRDVHAPETQIIWEQPQDINLAQVTPDYTVFASERWKKAPLLVGKRTEHGAILWLATSPGSSGYERYPYLLHAAIDLGLELPFKSDGILAFFDSSYRIRADVDYLAKRWRQAGISTLEVAAWHNMDGDTTQDDYLQHLIAACHRNAILVYAWLELPHVSEKFWADHPAWREKTAIGQDAQLDWRKLMNLQNPDCHREAARQIAAMLQRFDWDGVNLAELYFESLEGASNPARFTPMNDDVRSEFKEIGGFDPQLLFDASSSYSKNQSALRKFLDYRAVVAARMQSDWLKELEVVRHDKRYLDLVLTHIDDRFDPATRDELGADVSRVLPILRSHRSTLLVEDPATLWNLGPERYDKLASSYRKLSPDMKDIAVDINVVERYQDVYPTKKQTGVELLELVHQAASSFAKVALYGENSIDRPDLPLLPAAAVSATIANADPGTLRVTSRNPVRLNWPGNAAVDGKSWPLAEGGYISLPPGTHKISTAEAPPPVSIADFNGEVRSVLVDKNEVDLAYSARSRAILLLGSPASAVQIDGITTPVSDRFLLPAGQHVVTLVH